MNNEIARAEGKKVFESNRESAPALNQAFLKAACDSENSTVELFKAYTQGWAEAQRKSCAGCLPQWARDAKATDTKKDSNLNTRHDAKC